VLYHDWLIDWLFDYLYFLHISRVIFYKWN
jgi:hypothetical protein